MAKLPDNYLGPKDRILMLKKEYPNTASAIKVVADFRVVGETPCLLFKAIVEINGQVVAEGHAFTSDLDDAKAAEKTETVAIGRALVNAGYPETSETSDDVSEVAYTPAKKAAAPVAKASPFGGGRKSAAPVVEEEVEDEEEDEEEESEEEAETPPPPPKKSTPFGKTAAKKVEAEVVDEEPEIKTPAKKMTTEELLAKYKKPA